MMALVDLLQLIDFLLGEVDNLEVALNARLGHTLREHSDVWPVRLERDKDVCGMHVVLVCDLLHDDVGEQWRAV